MNKKIKFLLITQSIIVVSCFGIFYFFEPNLSNNLQASTYQINNLQTEQESFYTNNKESTNSKSLLLSIHKYIQSNQSSKALLLVDELYKENPNSSLSFLVASHIFLLKDQNQIAFENLQKAYNYQDYQKYNTHLDIQLNLILNNLNYFKENIDKINFSDPNQLIHYIIYLTKINNFQEIENLFKNQALLNNQLINNLKQDYDYYKTFKDSNINMLLNLWSKTLIKDQYIHYARSLLLDAIKNDASSHNSYLLLSYCYILSQNYTEALSILDKSKKIDPYNQNINFYLALLNYQENKNQESLNYLTKVSDPDFKNDKDKLLGLNLYKLKNYPQAAKSLEEYLKYNKHDLISMEYLLEIHFKHIKNLNKAYKLVQELEKNIIQSPEYYNLLGLSYLNLNNSQNSIENFNKALRLEPNHYPTLYNLAKIYIQNKNIKIAKENLKKGLNIAMLHNDKNYIQKFQNTLNQISEN